MGAVMLESRHLLGLVIFAVCVMPLGHSADAATTERVSIDSSGGQANNHSSQPSITPDGRYVAFQSKASDLVPNDTNGVSDIFVYDRVTDTIERVSVATGGGQANGGSYAPSISADGDFVAFESDATNLDTNDTNGTTDIFYRQRSTGMTTRIVDNYGDEANSDSYAPVISADGNYIAFFSYANNLSLLTSYADLNGTWDVFIYRRVNPFVRPVSVVGSETANGASLYPSINADGGYVAFQSVASDLVAGDTNDDPDIFVNNLTCSGSSGCGVVQIYSIDTLPPDEAEGFYPSASISGDGRYVVFDSRRASLVPGDTNDQIDVFLSDLKNKTVERISVNSAGEQADFGGGIPEISDDGRYVAFVSTSTNLIVGDRNRRADIFVRDLQDDTTQRVSISSRGVFANRDNNSPSISDDGRYVAFSSLATNLVPGDTNNRRDIFVRDRDPHPGVANDLVVDFGGAGLWERLDNKMWVKTTSASPAAVATGDLDGNGIEDTVASFSGVGLWARYNNSAWVKLHNATPGPFIAGDFNGNGLEDLAVDFGSAGLWVHYDDATWVKRHAASAQKLAVGDIDGNGRDDLIVDFGAGLWAFLNNSLWMKLHAVSPKHIATGDLDGSGKDEVIADFGSAGLWARYNNTTWMKLHSATTQGLATGDFDGSGQDEVLADFGAAGLWARYNNATWVKLHAASPTNMTAADLDSSGMEDVVADFGSAGLWARYNSATWVKLHSSTTQGLAAGGLD
jgi:Tol biopolymer transport system component